MENSNKTFSNNFWGFFKSKHLYIALLKIIGLVLVLSLSFFSILGFFTNHGERVQMPKFSGMHLSAANSLADQGGFELKIIDSIHVIGTAGGMVLKQQPLSGNFVKRSRTIYITISKYKPDVVKMAVLPLLYGKDFPGTQKLLKQSYNIESQVLGYQFDDGPENCILKAIYKNDTIESSTKRMNDAIIDKGSTLKFIISKATDDKIKMPELTCEGFDAAMFLINSSQLRVGTVLPDKSVINRSVSYVYKQSPSPSSNLNRDDTVTLYITQNQPPSCKTQ